MISYVITGAGLFVLILVCIIYNIPCIITGKLNNCDPIVKHGGSRIALLIIFCILNNL